MELRPLLDAVVGQRAAVLELLAREDQALLVLWDLLLVVDARLDTLDRVTGRNMDSDYLAGKNFYEDFKIPIHVMIQPDPAFGQQSAFGEKRTLGILGIYHKLTHNVWAVNAQ